MAAAVTVTRARKVARYIALDAFQSVCLNLADSVDDLLKIDFDDPATGTLTGPLFGELWPDDEATESEEFHAVSARAAALAAQVAAELVASNACAQVAAKCAALAGTYLDGVYLEKTLLAPAA